MDEANTPALNAMTLFYFSDREKRNGEEKKKIKKENDSIINQKCKTNDQQMLQMIRIKIKTIYYVWWRVCVCVNIV